MGRRTGEAIVVMENLEQVELAMKRHRHYLDQRYIEVTRDFMVDRVTKYFRALPLLFFRVRYFREYTVTVKVVV